MESTQLTPDNDPVVEVAGMATWLGALHLVAADAASLVTMLKPMVATMALKAAKRTLAVLVCLARFIGPLRFRICPTPIARLRIP